MNTIITFLAVLALAAFYAGLPGVRAGTAPLLALCSAAVFCSFAGVFGVLAFGGWAFLALCFGLFAVMVAKQKKAFFVKLASCPFILFFALGLLWLAFLAIRKPMFSRWDEFTLWGIAPKLMRQQGVLYTAADVGWWWQATQTPALMVLGWFVQFFGAPFAEWKVYFAYGLVYLACTCALVSLVPKQPRKALHKSLAAYAPLTLIGLLMPFFFNVFYNTIELNTTYLSAYGDLPAGMLAGAALCVYYACRADATKKTGLLAGVQKQPFTWWQPALVLAALALVKENSFPVALVAAGVMAADTLFFAKEKRVARRIAPALGYFAAAAAPYMAWARYINRIKTETGAPQTNISTAEAALIAARQLFNPNERTEQFMQTTQNLVDRFMGRNVVGGAVAEGTFNISMAGSGAVTCVLILVIFALAIVFAPNARRRGQIGLSCGLLAGGFAAYQFSLLVFYGVLFHARENMEIVDYDRYLGTYLMMWLICGIAFLAASVFNGGEKQVKEPAKTLAEESAEEPAKQPAVPPASDADPNTTAAPLRQTLALAAVVVLAAGMLLRFATLVRPGYSVLDYPENVYNAQKQRQQSADLLLENMPQNARVFFVCQGGGGGEWFEYSYYLLPAILEYSITGGGSFWMQKDPNDETDFGQTLPMVKDYLEDKGCDYIYVYNTDEVFNQNFGTLFEGGLQNRPNTPSLYKLGENGLYHFVVSG